MEKSEKYEETRRDSQQKAGFQTQVDEFCVSESEDPFQQIMEKAGISGRFQKIFNFIFVLGLSMCGAMLYMNIILALNIPDHWCTVPGRELTNFTLDEWRHITLPTQKDNRGADKFSSCEMYNTNFTQIDNWDTWTTTNLSKANVTACQHGWSYDTTWYHSTIPSKENWVCANDLYVTNVFVTQRVTEVFGSFVLGQMGDIFGRRPVYYISVLTGALGRLASVLTTRFYVWFLIFSGLVGFTVNSVFQSPQIIGMEISRESDRSTIVIYQCVGWSIGTTLMPMLFWVLRDWESFMWITTVPCLFVLVFKKYVIESPRWLISKRRFGDALLQFKKIAKINGRSFDMSEKELAQMYHLMQDDTTYGMASLFSGWRLARNTTIVGFGWCVAAVAYFTLLLFSSRMGGNPFLNFLFQTIVEIPAYLVGKFLADKYGRRFTNSLSFLVSFLCCIPILIYATDARLEWVMTAATTFIKFLNGITFFAVNLQSMEIYPTCMRQTGIALGSILANAVGVLAPFMVYLGTTVDIRSPYYILCIIFLLGGISGTFLPETLHRKLPDSMEEAREFGKYDKFFSLPKAPQKASTTAEDRQKLNQKKFSP